MLHEHWAGAAAAPLGMPVADVHAPDPLRGRVAQEDILIPAQLGTGQQQQAEPLEIERVELVGPR